MREELLGCLSLLLVASFCGLPDSSHFLERDRKLAWRGERLGPPARMHSCYSPRDFPLSTAFRYVDLLLRIRRHFKADSERKEEKGHFSNLVFWPVRKHIYLLVRGTIALNRAGGRSVLGLL